MLLLSLLLDIEGTVITPIDEIGCNTNEHTLTLGLAVLLALVVFASKLNDGHARNGMHCPSEGLWVYPKGQLVGGVVGNAVGCDGILVGETVGDTEGVGVGYCDGTKVGKVLGNLVGSSVGVVLGTAVGNMDGP